MPPIRRPRPGERDRRRRRVDVHGDRRRRVGVAGGVGDDRLQLVRAGAEAGRVPGRLVGSGRVGRDVRPRARRNAPLERDRGDAGAVSVPFAASATSGPPTVDPVVGWVIEPAGAVLSTRTVTVALVPAVARAVGRDGAQVVAAVDERRRRPREVERRRAERADVRPGARAGGAALVGDRGGVGRGRTPRSTRPAAALGAPVSVTVGASLSAANLRTAEVVSLPATSVATTRRSTGPSGAVRESQAVVQGEAVSVATVAKLAEPAVLTWNSTEATPEVASEALAERLTVPETRRAGGGRGDGRVGRGVVDRLAGQARRRRVAGVRR